MFASLGMTMFASLGRTMFASLGRTMFASLGMTMFAALGMKGYLPLMSIAPLRPTTLRRAVLAASIVFSAAATTLGAQVAPQRIDVVADDGHHLTLWSKRPPRVPRGEIVLLHGRTWSALPNFDLRVPRKQLSLMDALVARGYAVYALDQRGYGATRRDASGWLTPDRAAKDAAIVVAWVASRAPAARRPALLGYSRGAQTAALAAQRAASTPSALVLYGFPYDVEGYARNPEPASPPREKTTVEAAGEDFMTPDSLPAGVKAAYVLAATRSDPVRMDWRREEQFAAINPRMLKVPTLIINGERDEYVSAPGIGAFLARMGAVDRAWVVLSHADHAAHLERQAAFVNAVIDFLERLGRQR